MISRLTGHLRAAVGECRHDYLTITVHRDCEAVEGYVEQFAFRCRYCGDEIGVERL